MRVKVSIQHHMLPTWNKEEIKENALRNLHSLSHSPSEHILELEKKSRNSVTTVKGTKFKVKSFFSLR